MIGEPPTQSADGKAHFAFYDAARSLSFVWSGDPNQLVEVCEGGYGEPVVATFKAPVMISIPGFAKACSLWADEHWSQL